VLEGAGKATSQPYSTDTAELLLAADNTIGLWLERFVKHAIAHPYTSMWSLRIMVADPCRQNVVELAINEAHKEIEAFSS
jgi:hypothetical protein